MKRLHAPLVALALAFAAPLGFSALLSGEVQSALEATPVELNISTPTPLQEALALVTKQLAQHPSVVYKPGAESLPVPVMVVEQVRFADLLAALEDLLPVRFTIKNPNPKEGESSLLIVESAGRPTVVGASRFGGAMSSGTRPPGNRTASVSQGATPSTDDPSPLSISPGAPGTRSATVAPSPAGEEAPAQPFAGYASRPELPELAAAWIQPYSGLQPSTTRTFAIGSIVNTKGAPPVNDIIDAINLVWGTANLTAPKGDDAPRVALHEPSSLLIIKAPPAWQELAEEVISNLLKEHQAQLQQRQGEAETTMLKEHFQREAEHREQLGQIMLERLKAEHAAAIDEWQARVQELEAAISRLKAGG